jgi:serine/threonine protein kinase
MILAGDHAAWEMLARFRIEAQSAARLDHPNIVRVYDSGEHQGLPYFSMELVLGGSLAQKMTGRPWPVPTAARLVHTLALAMHHAHQQQVIHRDLKPGNVLFHRDGTPKISDFGLAKQLDSNPDVTGPREVLGSARYMAPEQAAGDSRAVSAATDVHGLGVILYELLTGRPAFDGSTLLEVLEQIRSGAPVSPAILRPDLPTDMEAVCVRCLRKDPARRYSTAEELARSLSRVLDAQAGTPAPSPSPRAPPDGARAGRSEWWRA